MQRYIRKGFCCYTTIDFKKEITWCNPESINLHNLQTVQVYETPRKKTFFLISLKLH